MIERETIARVYRTTYLPPGIDKDLTGRAKKQGTSVAALIRRYIEEGLKRERSSK